MIARSPPAHASTAASRSAVGPPSRRRSS